MRTSLMKLRSGKIESGKQKGYIKNLCLVTVFNNDLIFSKYAILTICIFDNILTGSDKWIYPIHLRQSILIRQSGYKTGNDA